MSPGSTTSVLGPAETHVVINDLTWLKDSQSTDQICDDLELREVAHLIR